MNTKYLLRGAILLILLLSISIAFGFSGEKQGKTRVLAHNEKEVSTALSEGCTVVRQVRTLTALVCDFAVASSLGLAEDIKITALDTGANTQTRANLVQVEGNNGEGRKIVILDTGYNYNHPELASSFLGGRDFVNNDNDPLDDNGHGSHVAGIITADGVDPKAKGIAPATGIISGKVLDATGNGYFSDMVTAIYWAVDGPDGIAGTTDDFNADAISMSIGSSIPYVYKGYCDSAMPDLTAAIKYAVDRGVVVVVAAGNEGSPGVSIPGCVSYSLTVGAVDSKDKVASFSSKGGAVDVTAPGVSIYSSWLGTQYKLASGTSMATPMVSATVALVKNSHPLYTPAQVQTALTKTAKDLGKVGWDSSYGWGRIDAYSAVKY